MERELIKKRFELLAPLLNERQLRLYVAAEALVLGRGAFPWRLKQQGFRGQQSQ
jgi:hypothetical protein